MKRFPGSILILLGGLLTCAVLGADGFQVKEGRYADGPTLELKLTPRQAKAVRSHFEPGMKIMLSRRQQAWIQARTNLHPPPTTVLLFHARDAADGCTCFMANWAFDFKEGWIEIPVGFLFTDEEAEDRRPDPNG